MAQDCIQWFRFRIEPAPSLLKQKLALVWLQVIEADLEGEAAEGGRIEPLQQVGGADEDAVELFHLGQHLVHLGDLPVPAGVAPVGEQAIGLIQHQDRALLFRLAEHGGDILLRSTHPHGEQVRGPFDHKRPIHCLSQVPGQGRFAGAGRAVEAEAGAGTAAQAGDH